MSNTNTFIWDSKNINTNTSTFILKSENTNTSIGSENTNTPIPDFKDANKNTLENMQKINHFFHTSLHLHSTYHNCI